MNARALLLVLVLIEPMMRLDLHIQGAVQSARRPALERPMRALTDTVKPVVAVSGLLAIAVFGGPSGVPMARGCLAVLIPVNLAVEALKWGVNRSRPDGDRNRRNSSFPSSHAANAFAIAWMLTRRWPRAWAPFFALSAVSAFSRMYLNRHYLSDVVAGGALALAVAAFVLHRWPALDPRRVRDARPGKKAVP
ncbi:MAG: phosphatase PAP2 family protein [Candidatus Eisenbacteria bacterium]